MGQIHDVIIIGGGASGSSLLYTLSKYTNIKDCVLIEKYDKPGQVNSKACNNSQTLHVGDIETNYNFEKVSHVHPASMMVVQYVRSLSELDQADILQNVSKMVLGVGVEEIQLLERRYEELLPLFPKLELRYDQAVGQIEPAVWEGREGERIVALCNPDGYAVNFEKLAQSFIRQACKSNSSIRVMYNSTVTHIEKIDYGFRVVLENGEKLETKVLVIDADSYSLYFAKQLGYGKEFSLIPIGGTFYFSRNFLKGKVYTVQDPELPFAAVHGDPDLEVAGKTRFGPTAKFYPVLESRNGKTFWDYLRSSGLQYLRTWISFFVILLSPKRFGFLFKNMLYSLPVIGKILFAATARKIVPNIKTSDLTEAKGYGGMRLQRVDTNTHQLLLGEGKIVGENGDKLIVNMTPSPGASVALHNASRDAEQLVAFLGSNFTFDKTRMEHDLLEKNTEVASKEISIHEGYPA